MIQEFITRFESKRAAVEAQFEASHPEDYGAIVEILVRALHDEDEYSSPDPERIHEINDGDYQGTLVFVIGASGYQPSRYWATKVDYGSCSWCDTLEAIRSYSSEPPTEKQVTSYMQLAINLLQGMVEV